MIDRAHYDGQMHRVPFSVGSDFSAKWAAYQADGFTVGLCNGFFFACKIMTGDPLPALPA